MQVSGRRDINATLRLVGREAVKRAARAITGQDAASALEAVGALVDEGQDLRRFASELLGLFRDMLVTKVSPKPEAVLELSKGEVEELAAIAAGINPEELIRVMNLLSRLADEMKWTTSPRISLELALVKAASRPINTVDEILEGIKGLKDAPAGSMVFGPGAPRQSRQAQGPLPKDCSSDSEGGCRYYNTRRPGQARLRQPGGRALGRIGRDKETG
jgi:DNA polymerase III gamma/tau subunit